MPDNAGLPHEHPDPYDVTRARRPSPTRPDSYDATPARRPSPGRRRALSWRLWLTLGVLDLVCGVVLLTIGSWFSGAVDLVPGLVWTLCGVHLYRRRGSKPVA